MTHKRADFQNTLPSFNYTPMLWAKEDSNLQGIAPTCTSSMRVYQFRHPPINCPEPKRRGNLVKLFVLFAFFFFYYRLCGNLLGFFFNDRGFFDCGEFSDILVFKFQRFRGFLTDIIKL